MSKAEAQKIAKEYVLKHRKSLKANNAQINNAVSRIAKVLTELRQPTGITKRTA